MQYEKTRTKRNIEKEEQEKTASIINNKLPEAVDYL